MGHRYDLSSARHDYSPAPAAARVTSARPRTPHVHEWKQVRVIQRPCNSERDGGCEGSCRSAISARLDDTQASIFSNLRKLNSVWGASFATKSACRPIGTPAISQGYESIVELTHYLASLNATDLPDVDALIERFANAVDAIARANNPARTKKGSDALRTVRNASSDLSQKLLPAIRNSKVNARIACDVLQHVEQATGNMLNLLTLARMLEQKRAQVDAMPTTEEALHARAEFQRAYDQAGRLFEQLERVIEFDVAKAQATIPKERRRQKTKVAIVIALALTAVALGIASIVIPPAVIGAVLAIKIASIIIGGATAGNSAYMLFAYSRPRPLTRLAKSLDDVRNLQQVVSRGLHTQQAWQHRAEALRPQFSAMELQTTAVQAESNQQAINRTLAGIGEMTPL